VQNDFAGQSLTTTPAKLTEYNLSPNSSNLNPTFGLTSKTAIQNLSQVSVPKIAGSTPFKNLSPNLAGIKKTVQWSSTSSGKVLR
jgi:hypothetical protein